MEKIVLASGTGEIEEKKSRFICNIFPIKSVEEAEEILNVTRKKYYDARHNCYAYILGDIRKCSDDGEPSQTAGRPMLDILEKEGLINCLAIVTRYFGGTLLGTGGLVRAYQLSTKTGLENSIFGEVLDVNKIIIEVGYEVWQKVEYILKQNEIIFNNPYYGERITLVIYPLKEATEEIISKLTSLTNGKLIIHSNREVKAAYCNNEIIEI